MSVSVSGSSSALPVNSDIQVIVGREDVSSYADNVSWSAVDPGGFEVASMDFQRQVRIPRGTAATINYGQSVAWEGRVNEVNRQLSAQPTTQLACQGYGARYKENGQSMIFVDRDANKWRGPSVARLIAIAAASQDVEAGTVIFDTNVNGQAGLGLQFSGAWSRNHGAESYYDAGPLNRVASTYFSLINNANVSLGDSNWGLQCFSLTQDGTGAFNAEIGDLIGGGGSFGANNQYITLATPRQFIAWQLKYVVAAGGEGVVYGVTVYNVAVYGDHRLTPRGTDPGGFTPDDIVHYVQRQAFPTTAIDAGVIEGSSYIVPHLTYETPVPWEQMIDDMAKTAGFHYGTWEGPRLDFRSYPDTPTCWTDVRAVDDLQINDSLDGLYNVINVSYRDTAGAAGVAVCSRSIAALDEYDITRTLYMDMGLATATTATAFGNIVLAISERNASSTGSFTTKLPVMRRGGDVPAFMLRPGIDRLKITDLTADGDGQTEMIVKHIAASVDSSGISTQVELGRGADLIEAMQARLQSGITALNLG